MPADAGVLVLSLGMLAGAYLLAMVLWSIARPDRRMWPPETVTAGVRFRVWFPTVLIFATGFLLGVLDWNRFDWPAWIRWGVGLPLIAIGNLIVWSGVRRIGLAATSGGATGLKTDGLYSWSRNPQYVADMAILTGWGVLCASLWPLPVLALGVLALMVAPFAEEPWLEEVYGEPYRTYKSRTRRYF